MKNTVLPKKDDFLKKYTKSDLYFYVKEIYKAFADVKLDGGIGYFEANLDDTGYGDDLHTRYIKARKLDASMSWQELYAYLIKNDNYNLVAYCLMDAKGQRFMVPILMLFGVADLLFSPIIENNQFNAIPIEIVQMLSQKEIICLCNYFKYQIYELAYYYNERNNIDFPIDDIVIIGLCNEMEYKLWKYFESKIIPNH